MALLHRTAGRIPRQKPWRAGRWRTLLPRSGLSLCPGTATFLTLFPANAAVDIAIIQVDFCRKYLETWLPLCLTTVTSRGQQEAV